MQPYLVVLSVLYVHLVLLGDGGILSAQLLLAADTGAVAVVAAGDDCVVSGVTPRQVKHKLIRLRSVQTKTLSSSSVKVLYV